MRKRGWWLYFGWLLWTVGCGGSTVYHRVRAGETLGRIAEAYGVSHLAVARANGLADPDRIEVGQKLRIPDANEERALVVARRTVPQPAGTPGPAPRFTWPVVGGLVTSGFGERQGSFHDGIDISAPRGTRIHAAAGGEVVYSGELRGYGNVVIVRHGEGYATVYAHNDQNHARERQWVRRGDLIATVGRSGRTTGPNLHFEIRHDNVAKDPLTYLRPAVTAISRSDTSGGAEP